MPNANDMSDMDTLARKVAAILDRDAVVLEPLSPGSSRGAMRVVTPDGEPIAFLRIDLGVASEVTAGKSLESEMAIVEHAHALGFPVPRVLGMVDEPLAAVMELARGTARPDEEEAERVGPEYMGHIARLHSMDPAAFGLASDDSVGESLARDLDAYEADASATGILDVAVVRLAFRVLRATMPNVVETPAFLHGDVGAGNFMVHEGKVSAILDWELAHAGDIHEDLAWLWVRGAHSAFGDPRQRLREYEAAAGHSVDPERLAWHIALVTLKSVIGLRRRMHADNADPGLLTIQIAILTYELLLPIALGAVIGIDALGLDEDPVDGRSDEARMIGLVGLLEPPQQRPTQVLLQYLEKNARQRAWRERGLREDCRERLGIEPDGVIDAIAAAGHSRDRLRDLVALMAAAGWRACKALPNAERRVHRAIDIGFGARVGGADD